MYVSLTNIQKIRQIKYSKCIDQKTHMDITHDCALTFANVIYRKHSLCVCDYHIQYLLLQVTYFNICDFKYKI